MKLRLNDLSKDGRDFYFDHETKDLNSALEDFLQGQTYKIQLHLRPLSSKTYEMKGTLEASIPSDCSKCAESFVFKLAKSFHEILTPPHPEDRTGRYSKSPLGTDEGISSYEYASDQTLDFGEYFHELIGISLPTYPQHTDLEISICEKVLKDLGVELGPEREVQYIESPKTPFAALQGLKLSQDETPL